MEIVFRVNYRTVPGQTLWLRLVALFTATGARIEQVMPLHWINDRQWEAAVELQGSGALRLSYNYQVRHEGNGVQLDEWLTPRVMELDPAARDTVVALDTWCSAGTPDYAFETAAFAVILPKRGPFDKPIAVAPEANHEFFLRMAAVPVGQVPCLIGSVRELGNWDWQCALPLQEVSANVWRLALSLPAAWHIEYKYGLYDTKSRCMISIEQGGNRLLSDHARGPRQWTRVCDEGYARSHVDRFRGGGVVVPVFSLRSALGLGVGEFADLKLLADWAATTGLKMIQILPINDTTAADDWTDSYPYSAISAFALHPLYLRIDDLPYPMPPDFAPRVAAARLHLNSLPTVDYEAVMQAKQQLTRSIYQHHLADLSAHTGIHKFLNANRDWLIPYAVFCVLRERHQTADFTQWGDYSSFDREWVERMVDKSGKYWSQLFYHVWLQYELDAQLSAAVRHMHDRGIALKGDLPIGVDRHSVDAWSRPHLFKLHSQAGAPPDAFAGKGQNWGVPTYHWDAMKYDGYAWWQARFAQLGRYFDAYRIDHILGFFRIWQIPCDQLQGVMGWFDPAIPVSLDELDARGIRFDFNRFCRPYIREHSLLERFGEDAEFVKQEYLEPCGYGYLKLKEAVSTQRRIVECFHDLTDADAPQHGRYAGIREALLDCVSEVLLLEVPDSNGRLFHPRCLMRMTRSYQELDEDAKWRLDELYNDYFYRRQEHFWQARGYEKLPVLRMASQMLLCGEDLGMVPACVAGVMEELGILALEIQRMPKNPQLDFTHPADAPYMSVVSPSTHDMSTLRGWWCEDTTLTGRFAWSMLGMDVPTLHLSGETAARIIVLHLHSPAMWAIFPLQDLLAIDETIRHPEPEAERVNVPAVMPHYWCYRMHLGLEQLVAASEFNERLHAMIQTAGR
jgi:4-alpha-glucanotransferase